jgi:RHS repeat-associated protein
VNAASNSLYSYSVVNSSGGSGYDAVGNVVAYTDSVNGTWMFGYDSLNRLASGAGSQTNNPYPYICWNYDSFGNRTAQSQQTTACSASNIAQLTSTWVYGNDNRVAGVSPPNSSTVSPSPYTYDASGNVTMDTVAGNQYLYDGEGRVCAVANTAVSGLPMMTQYIYDAEGHRVAKGSITSFSCDSTSNGFTATTVYVLGPGGEQLSELTSQSGTWQAAHTNVYAAGQQIATYDADLSGQTTGKLYFHLSDWLGTRRQQTDYAGNPVLNFTGLPYGDGLSTVPVSTASAADATEHHFTGKERDTESGNDYFEARYYASSMGRFLSPDWSAKEEPVPYAKLDNPQSLNLYSYVLNNPLTAVDDDGHEIIYMTSGPNALKNEQVVRDSVTAILANPNTAGQLSGYVGKDNPDLVIMSGDLSNLDSHTQNPDGTPGSSITKGDFEPVMSTSTDANGKPTDSKFSGGIITIDNRTTADETPGVITHETVHGGDARANPSKFVKDAAAEKSLPHDKRPQEQHAIGVEKKFGPQITKAVKQIEKQRKKEQSQ